MTPAETTSPVTTPPDGATGRPWRLLALPPLPLDVLRAVLADVPVDVTAPETRDDAGLRAALPTAELVLGDWSGRLGLGAAEVAAAPLLAFVQQPSVGF